MSQLKENMEDNATRNYAGAEKRDDQDTSRAVIQQVEKFSRELAMVQDCADESLYTAIIGAFLKSYSSNVPGMGSVQSPCIWMLKQEFTEPAECTKCAGYRDSKHCPLLVRNIIERHFKLFSEAFGMQLLQTQLIQYMNVPSCARAIVNFHIAVFDHIKQKGTDISDEFARAGKRFEPLYYRLLKLNEQ